MKLLNKEWFLFLSIVVILNGYAQENKTQYLLELQTTQAFKNTVPFWLWANTYGRIPKKSATMLYTAISGDINNATSNFQYSYKIGTTFYSADKNVLFIDELYGDLKYKNWGLTVGVKHDAQVLKGLSSSYGTITKSNNTRAYPGYEVYLIDFVKLPFAKKWLSIKGNYGDFLLNDKRSVQNAKLHTKSIFIRYKLNDTWEIITGLNHYAIWGGKSKIYGKQPVGFKNYLKVISGSSGGSDALKTDQINVIGNQLGSYQLQLNYKGEKTNWKWYWSHLFEDRSGREMMNYPDALYGLFLDFKKSNATISHLLAEVTYTKHASGNDPHYTDENGFHAASGMDNYFNNGVYQSGWTYFGNTIGSPYFTTKPIDSNGITNGIIDGDNRFMAFNLGLKGTIKELKYKVILSHITYFGWFENEYKIKPTQFSGLLEIKLPKIGTLPFKISVATAFDTGTYATVNFGGFLKLSSTGIF